MKNFLLIVEGIKTEPTIFETIFTDLGYRVIIEGERLNLSSEFKDLAKKTLGTKKDNVVIIQGPKNRINELITLFEDSTNDINRIFDDFKVLFSGIFWIYDVDHTSNESLIKMLNRYQSETEGMLLVSSPCIEVLAIPNFNEEVILEHLKQFKTIANILCEKNFKCNAREHIIKNFYNLAVIVLDKNVNDFNEENILEHPNLVINKINKENKRTSKTVVYRYYTTVIYVAVAYILGLTKEINNYKVVRRYFIRKGGK